MLIALVYYLCYSFNKSLTALRGDKGRERHGELGLRALHNSRLFTDDYDYTDTCTASLQSVTCKSFSPSILLVTNLRKSFKKSIRNLFNMDGPKGSMKALSHIEGPLPWVTGLNLDQWTSRCETVQKLQMKTHPRSTDSYPV